MQQLTAAWKLLTLRCEEASRLASESLDRTLPFSDRLAMRLHQRICPSCRHFERQVVELRRISTRVARDVPPASSSTSALLPEDVRDRIKQSLKAR